MLKFFRNRWQQASFLWRINRGKKTMAFVAPESDVALSRGGVAGQQFAGLLCQWLAAEPGRPGQIVPVGVQAGKRQALAERVFDFNRVAALIFVFSGMQWLVNIGY